MSADMLVEQARKAGECARERIAAAVAELSLPVHARLSDRQHASVLALIHGFLASAEAELRARLIAEDGEIAFPPETKDLIAGAQPLAEPILAVAGIPRDPLLVAAALRRADAHAARLAQSGVNGTPDPVERLKESAEPAIADAVIALLVTENRRLGQFQEPLLIADDLPRELARRIIWLIGASLRQVLLARSDVEPATCDRRIANAVNLWLSCHDESAAIEARATLLAHRLHATDALYDDLIVTLLERGRLTLFIAALAARAGLDYSEVSDIIADPIRSGLTVLLRAIDMRRPQAAAVLLQLDPDTPARVIEERMAAFEALDPDHAREALRPRRLDPDYRAAIATLHRGPASPGWLS